MPQRRAEEYAEFNDRFITLPSPVFCSPDVPGMDARIERKRAEVARRSGVLGKDIALEACCSTVQGSSIGRIRPTAFPAVG